MISVGREGGKGGKHGGKKTLEKAQGYSKTV